MTGLITRGKSFFQAVLAWLNRVSGGRLEIVSQSYRHFIQTGGPFTAASLSYYALFSLFPLVLFMILFIGLLVTNSEVAYFQTIQFMRNVLPVSVSLLERTMLEALKLRGQISVIGVLTLLWAASGYFSTLIIGINRAWPSVKLRNPVQSRLIALVMIGGVLILLLLSLLSTLLGELLPVLFDDSRFIQSIIQLPIWQGILRAMPLIFSFLMFLAMYRWLPNKAVNWQAAWIGALVTSLGWEAARFFFGLFMGSGTVNYDLIYGSLGAVAALLLWIYFSNAITLFGAHLVSTLETRAEKAEQPVADELAVAPVPSNGKPRTESIHPDNSSQQDDIPAKRSGIDDPLMLVQPLEQDQNQEKVPLNQSAH